MKIEVITFAGFRSILRSKGHFKFNFYLYDLDEKRRTNETALRSGL